MSKKNDSTLNQFNSKIALTTDSLQIDVDYDIYEHRVIEHPNTFLGALTHITKTSLGTGILAIPYAFKSSGLVIGFIGTLIIGFLCTHAIQMLIEASHKVCKIYQVPSMGFPETAEAVFKVGPSFLRSWSTFSRNFVYVALCLTHCGVCSVYVVLIRDSIVQILVVFYPDIEKQSLAIVGIVMVGLMICCQIRDLKYLVPFSAVANITMFTTFAITFYYMAKDFDKGGHDDLALVKGIDGLPKFLTTVIFAIEGVGMMLPVENSMPKSGFLGYFGVLNIAMTIVILLYATMGFFGYLVYGETLQDSITYNMPKDEALALIGRGCISVAVFCTFLLLLTVPMDISWRFLRERFSEKHHNLVQIIWRPFCVVLITAAAVSVPNLGTIINLVGAVFVSILGLFTPAAIDIVLRWESGLGRFWWRLFKNLVIVALSLSALGFGVYITLTGH